MELDASRAYIKALEYGLHAVLASHPTPGKVKELWAHTLPEIIDVHSSAPGTSVLFHAAFQTALSRLTELVDGADARSGAGTAKDD